jgi:NifB/MoaA-like Fe-S oxidoreductase
MVADFLRTGRRVRIPSRIITARVTVVTGVSFAPILRASVMTFMPGIASSIRVITVRNAFFGQSVTVAGLLTGRDILQTVQGKRLGTMLLIPANTLKDGEDTFLDGMRLTDLERAVGVPVRPVRSIADLVRSHNDVPSHRSVQ